ncbi:N-acetyltransferase [Thermodesulfobacteriota bacterium]
MRIRKARTRDVKRIFKLLEIYGEKGELLPRPFSALYDHVRDFLVCEEGPEGQVVGCCALQICWEDLAEIRSLAVDESHWNQGYGSALVRAALSEAEELGLKEVFVLTYRPLFFERHGFLEIDKKNLPQKIWADCLNCLKFPDCDEVAMTREL